MTQREKLIELLLNVPPISCIKGGRETMRKYQTCHHIADYLLANGVIVPPYKVGDMVDEIEKTIYANTGFLTKEEVEAKMKGSEE